MPADQLSRTAHGVLDRIEHATVATVSSDGQPWNTPVYFAWESESLFWISRRDAQHSKNIQHNRRAFIVVFDSSSDDATGAGVYLQAEVVRLEDENDIQAALELIYRRRKKPALPASRFAGDSVHAVYQARVIHIWSNVLHTSGDIPWDERVEIRST